MDSTEAKFGFKLFFGAMIDQGVDNLKGTISYKGKDYKIKVEVQEIEKHEVVINGKEHEIEGSKAK